MDPPPSFSIQLPQNIFKDRKFTSFKVYWVGKKKISEDSSQLFEEKPGRNYQAWKYLSWWSD